MNKEELQILSNVLQDEYGVKFIQILLRELGAFERGLNCQANDREIFMTLGKRAKGCWLLDNVLKADEQIYLKILKEKEKVL